LSFSNNCKTKQKEYIELGDPSIGLSCLVLKRKYEQVRRRTELAYVHGEKRAIGRLLTFLIRQFFSNEELRHASLDGRVRNTQALAQDRMKIIDEHLQTIFGLDYNLYRLTKDCAEQVNVVCRHARNPKNFYENSTKIDDNQLDNYESFQEELFIQANGDKRTAIICIYICIIYFCFQSRFTIQNRLNSVFVLCQKIGKKTTSVLFSFIHSFVRLEKKKERILLCFDLILDVVELV